MTLARPQVLADGTKCRGCQTCQLICSFRRDRVFNPAKAALVVQRLGGETEFAVSFTPRCDHCGVCVRYCLYGALSQEVAASAPAGGR